MADSDFVDVLSSSVDLGDDAPNIRWYRTCDLVIFYLHEKAGRCFNQSIKKKDGSAEFFGEFSWILPVWSCSKLLDQFIP